MKSIILFIVITPILIIDSSLPQFVFWNVGQGQFTTLSFPQECLHFDFGGEQFPSEVLKLCQFKKNVLYLSHEDLDHYSFIKKLSKNTKFICSVSKIKKFKYIELCEKSKMTDLLFEGFFKDKNSNSKIFVWNNKFLFTGDSTQKSEKLWAHRIPKTIQYWTVPHHGSKTSSSEFLIKNIPKSSLAIISSRKEKYGHPHSVVINRIKAKKIPVLKTQDWGHIKILLRMPYSL